MSEQPPQCWLEGDNGRRISIGPRGLIAGRSLASDLLLTDATASRRAAFVYADLEGLWVVKVGRSSVKVNHTEVDDSQALREGDTLRFPGSAYVVHVGAPPSPEAASWVLRREAAPAALLALPRVHPLTTSSFCMGGHPDDSLHIPGWPPSLVQLSPAQPSGWTATLGAGLALDGVPLDGPTQRRLTGDERLGYGGVVYRLVEVAVTQRDTLHSLPVEPPDRVSLQPMVPSGGSITLGFGELEVTTWVPGVRYDLLQALLSPPAPYAPGDPLPDAVLMPLVWGRQIPSDRKAVTTVLKRLRRDLEKGGLAGSLLVDRSQGRSTFRLAPGAQVEILEPR
jgi:hypothetical protein